MPTTTHAQQNHGVMTCNIFNMIISLESLIGVLRGTCGAPPSSWRDERKAVARADLARATRFGVLLAAAAERKEGRLGQLEAEAGEDDGGTAEQLVGRDRVVQQQRGEARRPERLGGEDDARLCRRDLFERDRLAPQHAGARDEPHPKQRREEQRLRAARRLHLLQPLLRPPGQAAVGRVPRRRRDQHRDQLPRGERQCEVRVVEPIHVHLHSRKHGAKADGRAEAPRVSGVEGAEPARRRLAHGRHEPLEHRRAGQGDGDREAGLQLDAPARQPVDERRYHHEERADEGALGRRRLGEADGLRDVAERAPGANLQPWQHRLVCTQVPVECGQALSEQREEGHSRAGEAQEGGLRRRDGLLDDVDEWEVGSTASGHRKQREAWSRPLPAPLLLRLGLPVGKVDRAAQDVVGPVLSLASQCLPMFILERLDRALG
mmetsp:Transcript_40101/g.126613  ORF Transcript_40101/g.126613 Transcript_40101/m.126613 type:complete len:434 (-) Transcript_40101:223-1524(-)